MRHAMQLVASQRLRSGMLAAWTVLTLACTGQVGGGNNGTGATSGTGGAGPSGSGGAVANCTPAEPTNVVAPQRVVRLTLNEVTNAIGALFPVAVPVVPATVPPTTTAIATVVTNQFMIGNPTQRTFPPLNSTREGVSIISDRWRTLDQIASTVAKYVFDNFAAVTRCTTVTDACAQTYLSGLAAAAYRRPLDTAPSTGEAARLTALYTTLRAAAIGSTIQEATQNGVYAILSAPQFLYRSELGNPGAISAATPGVPLTPYEVASQLSFFLTDGPPDQMLLAAAQAGRLTTPAGVLTEFDRLITTPAARENLSAAMFGYFKLNLLDNARPDPIKFPEFTIGLENAMYTEADMFLKSVLWSGKMTDVLTSTTTFINSDLATTIYKVPVPAGATQTTFVQTTLPAATWSGIITQSGFITSRARTDATSVVARGLAIQETMLCGSTPPAPTSTLGAAISANLNSPDTEKEKARIRDTTQPCLGCHAKFDSFGLVLENYDAIGRYRTVDDMNRPIDASTTLPDTVGGVTVQNAVEFAQKLGGSPAFVTCIAKSLMQYALSDVTSAPVPLGGCAVQGVAKAFTASSDQSFTQMVRQVAVSNAVARRTLTQ